MKSMGNRAVSKPMGTTRNEYLRLLLAAKSLHRERTYLLIKVFACTGIRINQLPDLTTEAVREGCIVYSDFELRIPNVLCDELLDYAERKGICSGAIFCTRNGNEIDRSNLTHAIRVLADAACVPPEKCSPRCLQRMYRETQAQFRKNVDFLVIQASDRMIGEEQKIIGWK